MSSGLTPDGFERKRLDEIIADLQANFAAVFGVNLNTSPESPDGQIIGVVGGSLSDLWEIAEGSYNSYNPSVATGVALSNLVQINNITRREATASTAELTLTGVNGTIIPAGSLVSINDNSAKFSTDSEVTIPVSGTITVGSTATQTGPTPALAGTITVIDNPITGWNTVNNLADAVLGTDVESDSELRARRENSVSRAAKSVLDTILAEVLSVDGVTEGFIFENDSKNVDPITNTPANSFQVVVLGGDDDEIGTAIFNEKPVGIESFGTTIVIVNDSQGKPHNIGFTRPAAIPIYVIVNIEVDSNYPVDGDDQIKQNIVDYANGELVTGRGFGVSDDVINSRLYTPVNKVEGHSVVSILIGTTPSPTLEDDITIDFDQISEFLLANITVNQV